MQKPKPKLPPRIAEAAKISRGSCCGRRGTRLGAEFGMKLYTPKHCTETPFCGSP